MSKREKIKTKAEQIIAYWKERIPDNVISVPWGEADTYCWRCGCERKLQRCHIIPYSLGGIDAPENFVLLCRTCHVEGPNISDPDIMWDWINAYSVDPADIFPLIRALKEYEFIYKRSVKQDIDYITEAIDNTKHDELTNEYFDKHLKLALSRATIHYGHAEPNPATVAGVIRLTLKNIAKDYLVPFPPEEHCEHNPNEL